VTYKYILSLDKLFGQLVSISDVRLQSVCSGSTSSVCGGEGALLCTSGGNSSVCGGEGALLCTSGGTSSVCGGEGALLCTSGGPHLCVVVREPCCVLVEVTPKVGRSFCTRSEFCHWCTGVACHVYVSYVSYLGLRTCSISQDCLLQYSSLTATPPTLVSLPHAWRLVVSPDIALAACCHHH